MDFARCNLQKNQGAAGGGDRGDLLIRRQTRGGQLQTAECCASPGLRASLAGRVRGEYQWGQEGGSLFQVTAVRKNAHDKAIEAAPPRGVAAWADGRASRAMM